MEADQLEVKQILAEEKVPSLNIAYQEAERMVELQFGQIGALEVKASILMGFGGVLLALFLALLSGLSRFFDIVTFVLVITLYVTVILSIGCSLLATRPRTYKNAPSFESLRDKYMRWEEDETRYHLFFELKRASEKNQRTISSKIRLVKFSYAALELCLAFALITALYQFYHFVRG